MQHGREVTAAERLDILYGLYLTGGRWKHPVQEHDAELALDMQITALALVGKELESGRLSRTDIARRFGGSVESTEFRLYARAIRATRVWVFCQYLPILRASWNSNAGRSFEDDVEANIFRRSALRLSISGQHILDAMESADIETMREAVRVHTKSSRLARRSTDILGSPMRDLWRMIYNQSLLLDGLVALLREITVGSQPTGRDSPSDTVESSDSLDVRRLDDHRVRVTYGPIEFIGDFSHADVRLEDGTISWDYERGAR